MALRGRGRTRVGAWGEERAAQFLQALGWSVVERNWRCPRGEIDLVVRQPDGTTVLVEVKTRSGSGYGSPLEAITVAKQAKLRELATIYRREQGIRRVRVDAVGVLRTRDGVELSHVRGVLS